MYTVDLCSCLFVWFTYQITLCDNFTFKNHEKLLVCNFSVNENEPLRAISWFIYNENEPLRAISWFIYNENVPLRATSCFYVMKMNHGAWRIIMPPLLVSLKCEVAIAEPINYDVDFDERNTILVIVNVVLSIPIHTHEPEWYIVPVFWFVNVFWLSELNYDKKWKGLGVKFMVLSGPS